MYGDGELYFFEDEMVFNVVVDCRRICVENDAIMSCQVYL
jgi:hypothetical protein